jgi:hypothetical protein
MIVGPVGSLVTTLLVTAPSSPTSAPKAPDRITIAPNRSVHWRAAAAGATIMALISTPPTVCRPTTMAMTIKNQDHVQKVSSQ